VLHVLLEVCKAAEGTEMLDSFKEAAIEVLLEVVKVLFLLGQCIYLGR
jgi:hypothetical protein